MRSTSLLRSILGVATFSAFALSARAEVAFDDFGPGDSYGRLSGYAVCGPTSIVGEYAAAAEFTSAVSGELGSITFADYAVNSSSPALIEVYSEIIGLPGTLLGSVSVPVAGSKAKIYTARFAPGVSLVSGGKYWVKQSTSGDALLAWNIAIGSHLGILGDYTAGGVKYEMGQLPTLRVETRTVPEPSSIAALGVGLLAAFRRRRKE